jgi:ABC-type amino acid transport substrate-binding protein
MKLAVLFILLTGGFLLPAGAHDIAPGGTLRAVYLGSNPAQAMRDPASGEVRGAAADLARELAQRGRHPARVQAGRQSARRHRRGQERRRRHRLRRL